MKKFCLSISKVSNSTYYHSLPDMAEAHKQSFFRFLSKGLEQELSQHFPIFLNKGRVQVILERKSFRFKAPSITLKNAYLKRSTYSIPIYFKVIFLDVGKNLITSKWICFGSIPVCTSGGWFMVRGLRRILLHQLIRSPGCYASILETKPYQLLGEVDDEEKIELEVSKTIDGTTLLTQERIDESSANPCNHVLMNTPKHTEILILPDQGTWLRFSLSTSPGCHSFFVQWGKQKNQRTFVSTFLQILGISSKQIQKYLRFNSNSLKRSKEQKIDKENNHLIFDDNLSYTKILAILKDNKNFKNQKLNSRRLWYRRFFNPNFYRLGHIGRFRLNRRLGYFKSSEFQVITTTDILIICQQLVVLSLGLMEVDDIDHLQNKRLRSCGDFLQECFQNGFKQNLRGFQTSLNKSIPPLTVASKGEVLKTYYGVKNTYFDPNVFRVSSIGPARNCNKGLFQTSLDKRFVNVKTPILNNSLSYRISNSFHSFFATSPISQPLHQTNPIDAITHERRCTSLGPKGLTREHAGIAVRGIHPSHFGRLCPVETPEGQNTGLVNSPAYCTRVNYLGFFETPYWPVRSRKLLKTLGAFYLSSNQENHVWTAPNETITSKSGYLSNSKLVSRSGTDFSFLTSKQLNYFGILPNQMFSLGASLIPFMEHDDGNRALMGSNMQRQAVPLLENERPLIGTGLESLVSSDARVGVRALAAGYVYYVSGEKILIHSLIHWRKPINQYETIEYKLGRYETSNQGTCIDQKPIINVGAWVHVGDLLAEGYSTKQGELALGRNLCVAYVPWEGYNYEDAVVINESLVDQDVLTSIHIKKYETELETRRVRKKQLKEQLSGDFYPKHPIPGITENQLLNLDHRGVIRIGAWVEPNDILVGKLVQTEVSLRPEEKLVHAIFGTKPSSLQDTSFRVPKYIQGRVINVEISRRKNSVSQVFRIYIAQRRRIQIGDKIAGRHGNKGVISCINPRQDMPYLQNGLDVDILLNPLGIPSRMNVGQVYEGLLGLASRYLGRCFRVLPFDEGFGFEASRGMVYSQLAQLRAKSNKKWLFDPQASGKSRIFDGRTGQAFEQSILVTLSYILKLEHQVDEKIHARSTGPYSLVTQQPVRGRSRRGGQRLGEMEVWAVEAYGSAFLLCEMLSIKSDDVINRQKATSEILRNQYGLVPAEAIRKNEPESFKVLTNELKALCLDFQYSKFN